MQANWGILASHVFTLSFLVGGVIVEDQMDVQVFGQIAEINMGQTGFWEPLL